MNKTELVNAMAEKAGLSKVDAKKALDAFVEAVSESLVKGDKVALIGFGTCLLYTSPSPRDRQKSRMPSSA